MEKMDSAQPGAYSAKTTFIRLLALGRPYIGTYAVLCAIAAGLSISGVLLAESLRRVINGATEHDVTLLIHGTMLGIGVVLFDVLANVAKTYLTGMLEFKSTARLQATVLGKLMRARMNKLDRYHSSDLISRINDSASAAQSGVNARAIDLLSNLLQVVFMLFYLVSLNFMLTAGTVAISLLTPLVMLPFTRRLRGLYEARQKAQSEQQAFVQDTVQGAEVVRAYSLVGQMGRKFVERFNAYLAVHRRVLLLEAIGHRMMLVVFLVGILYVLGFGGLLVIRGTLDVGALAAFLISFERIANPLGEISNQWTQLQTAMGQANRMFEVIDLPEECATAEALGETFENLVSGSGTGTVPEVWSDLAGSTINLDHVKFRYDDAGDEVLRGATFAIETGQMTALAGPSGGGKSTILSLLLRMYEPTDGEIRCGGVLLSGVELRRWREGIAYVSQEPYLFSGTLFENIAYGKPEARMEEVEAAAREAGIHDFIMSTPNQYETRVGERGMSLSGGERQRVSIARAFLRNPRLLLLDEPTSALDSRNEEIVQQALSRLMRGRTTVVVAHRLSTIQDADRIVFLENGQVRETGTHAELMSIRGRYFAMFEANLSSANPGSSAVSSHASAVELPPSTTDGMSSFAAPAPDVDRKGGDAS